MAKSRDDFTLITKDLLAKRAGYTCSFPNCGLRTIGAGADSDSATASIGVAAHNHAAALGGPRYDPKQEQRHHAIANGIWLCQTHSRLIGVDHANYPATLLRQWKKDAETLLTAVHGEKHPPVPQLTPNELPDRGNLPPNSRLDHRPNPAFVGHHQDLLDLNLALNVVDKAVITPLAAATAGMGGIGKTQLAIEYAYRYGRFYPGDVFWLDFGEPAQVPSGLVTCGVKMQLFKLDDPNPQEVKVELVQQSWTQGSKKRLLIFDNCESEDLLDTWVPRSGPNQVLVTSRNQYWSPALGLKQCRLGLLAREESIELLRELHAQLTEELANAIATELGDLPLALYLAGSYLAYYKEDPVTYLAELPNQPLQHSSLIGSKNRYQPTKHDTQVGRTFARSFERLDPQDPTDSLARALLLHAVQFAPGGAIVEQLLLATVETNEHAKKKGLVRLLELGLIQYKDQTLLLHRLLQHFCNEAFPAEHQNQAETKVAKVVRILANVVNNVGLPSRMAPLLTHLRYLSERLFPQDTALTLELTFPICYHLETVSA